MSRRSASDPLHLRMSLLDQALAEASKDSPWAQWRIHECFLELVAMPAAARMSELEAFLDRNRTPSASPSTAAELEQVSRIIWEPAFLLNVLDPNSETNALAFTTLSPWKFQLLSPFFPHSVPTGDVPFGTVNRFIFATFRDVYPLVRMVFAHFLDPERCAAPRGQTKDPRRFVVRL